VAPSQEGARCEDGDECVDKGCLDASVLDERERLEEGRETA
jgi:hypothetical protein